MCANTSSPPYRQAPIAFGVDVWELSYVQYAVASWCPLGRTVGVHTDAPEALLLLVLRSLGRGTLTLPDSTRLAHVAGWCGSWFSKWFYSSTYDCIRCRIIGYWPLDRYITMNSSQTFSVRSFRSQAKQTYFLKKIPLPKMKAELAFCIYLSLLHDVPNCFFYCPSHRHVNGNGRNDATDRTKNRSEPMGAVAWRLWKWRDPRHPATTRTGCFNKRACNISTTHRGLNDVVKERSWSPKNKTPSVDWWSWVCDSSS